MIMKLSTSTNLFSSVMKNGELLSMLDRITRCYKAGFDVIDINFCPYKGDFGFLGKNNWEETVNKMNEIKEELSLEYTQSHIPFYGALEPFCFDNPNREWMEEMVRRSIVASGMLGVKWAVMHPGTAVDSNCSRSISKQRNIEYFAPWIEFAEKHNVGIAIENMADLPNHKIVRRYGSDPEELCDLVDYFNSENVGVCWDTGHANLMYYEQSISLKVIGSRLKALHINDNHNKDDDHLIPFYGNIEWNSIMRTLKEIKYDGDFTYEIQGHVQTLPDGLVDEIAIHAINIGNYLLNSVSN